MAVQIIVDSTADFSAKEIEKRQITCIPMTQTVSFYLPFSFAFLCL